MKIILILLFLPIFSLAQTSDSLLIYYNFNRNGQDQSGNDNHADIKDCNYLSHASDTANSAIYIAGYKNKTQDSGFVAIPEVLDGSSEFTLSILVKYMDFEPSSKSEESFVSFGSLLNGGTGATGIYYRESDKRLIFAIQTIKGNYYSGYNWNTKWDNSFQHFAMTYNSSTGIMSCFHNGQLLGEKTNIYGEVESYSNKAAIGKHYWSKGSLSSKRMEFAADELYVFSKSLDTVGIKDLYKNSYFVKIDSCTKIVTVFDTIKIYDTVRVLQYDTMVTKITQYDTLIVTVEDTLIAFFNYVSIENKGESAQAIIYPNPVNSYIYISIDDFANMENVEFEILDINGQSIQRKEITQSVTIINMSAQSRGLYIMKLYQNNRQILGKKLILR